MQGYVWCECEAHRLRPRHTQHCISSSWDNTMLEQGGTHLSPIFPSTCACAEDLTDLDDLARRGQTLRIRNPASGHIGACHASGSRT